MAKKKKKFKGKVYVYRNTPKKKGKRRGRRKSQAGGKGFKGVMNTLKNNPGVVVIGALAAMLSRGIFGFITSEEDIDGSIVKREGANAIALPIAALGPALALSMVKKASPLMVTAALVGGVGSVIADVLTPTIAQKIADLAPDNPQVVMLASGMLVPVDILAPPVPGDEDFIGPLEEEVNVSGLGALPEGSIALTPAMRFSGLPDRTIRGLPDATIGMGLPDATIGNIYQYNK